MQRVRSFAVARVALGTIALGVLHMGPTASGAVIFGNVPGTIQGGFRWDAAPRMIGANERSLAGGLRYSLQGGSFQAYRDLFSWNGPVPTVAAFQQAVQDAFNAWTVVDPVSGLGTTISFVADLNTAVVGVAGGGVNVNGAEIDLLASTDASNWNVGNAGTQGETFFNAIGSTVTLTSGTVNYANSGAISGADITINSNPGALYTLDLFRRLLTHEIGHAIGLGDIEGTINAGVFIDDNFAPGNPLATMTNSWAALVNPLNPGASPLNLYAIGGASTTAGVDILMESNGLGIAAGNPVTNLTPMANDDFGGRQFLYPVLAAVAVTPEPASIGFAMMGVAALSLRRRRNA